MRDRRFYLPQLDGLRCLAFLLVFLHHAPFPSNSGLAHKLHSFGWVGVDLFFVLSAYLMTSLLLREYDTTGKISIKSFYIRRILRIWPLYFFAVLIGFIVLPAYSWGGEPMYYELIKNYLLPYIIFTANIPIAILGYPSMSFPALAHLWTISYEEQFYAILPILIVSLVPFKPSSWFRCLLFIFGLGLAVRISLWLMDVSYLSAWVLPLARPDSFIVGMMIAFGIEKYSLLSRVNPSVLVFLALALSAVVIYFPPIELNSIHNIWRYTAVSLTMGAVLLLSLRDSSWLCTCLATGPLRYLGKISYGLYVYHLLALAAAHYSINLVTAVYPRTGPTTQFIFETAGALTLTIAVSAVSYRWLEKPFLRWKANYEVIKSRRA